MNSGKFILTIASVALMTSTSFAQEKPAEGVKTTSSKTYKVNMGDEIVSKTVEISTQKSNAIKLDQKDEGKIDQDRLVDGKAMITKTVKIDNDKDDAFDEKIVFTYESTTPEDFVLVSNKEELVVAIADGENLKIVEGISLKSKKDSSTKSTYIYTDQQGKEIEFLVEEHVNMTSNKSESK